MIPSPDTERRVRDLWKDHEAAEPIPVWLDVDTGHDVSLQTLYATDAFALLLAGHCPRFRLLGVSTVHGNSSLQNTTSNTLSILEAIGLRDVPVYPIATGDRDEVIDGHFIHGESGLDGTTLLPRPISRSRREGLSGLYQHIMSTKPKTTWLIATGPLSNVATTFATYPELAAHLAGVSIMGGAVGFGFTDVPLGTLEDRLRHPEKGRLFTETYFGKCQPGKTAPFGNVTPWAEFNIFSDPLAASAVLKNSSVCGKIIIATLDLTHQVLASAERVSRIRHGVNGISEEGASLIHRPLRELFCEILTFFSGTYRDVFGMDSPPLHDPVAVFLTLAYVLDPTLALGVKDSRNCYHVCVDDGDQQVAVGRDRGQVWSNRGRMILDPGGEQNAIVPMSIDVEAFWVAVDYALDRAEHVSPMRDHRQ